ncbi:MAG: hypothetical protein JST00_41985 [Deltaproteobacteria bacterium]|nr:hypothetical protein [Deltaproteobacteria bacterium]
MTRRRSARVLAVGGLAFALPSLWVSLGAVGAGCSTTEDAPPSEAPSRPDVDPGGTFGAEINVRVVGRGRVKDAIGGLSCPSGCFARYVYRDRAAAGATDRVTLIAEAATGARFVGWTFEATPLGTRGRGPDRCSPLTRAAATPPGDLAAATIDVALGEIAGKPPAGRETECVDDLAVPLAYDATATFVEAASDGGDGGDGSREEVYLEPPVLGYRGRDVVAYGSVVDTLVYWLLESGSTTRLAFAQVSGATKSVTTVVNTTLTDVRVRHMGPIIAMQTGDGTMATVRASLGDSFGQTFSSGGTICRALATDESTVFCRTDDSVVTFDLNGVKRVLHSGLTDAGSAIGVASSPATGTTALLFTGPNGDGGLAIQSAPRFGDGGVPPIQSLVGSVTSDPKVLAANQSNVLWLEANGGSGRAFLASNAPASTTFAIGPGPSPGLEHLRLDPRSETGAFLASSAPAAILQSKGTAVSSVRAGLPSLGGLAVTPGFVYWTDDAGRVLRIARPQP